MKKFFAGTDAKEDSSSINVVHVIPDNDAKKLDGLGSGDSILYQDIMPKQFANEEMFRMLREEVNFQEMTQAGGVVPRLVAIQGIGYDGEYVHLDPIYRHPTDSDMIVTVMTPTVLQIKEALENMIGNQVFNHVLIQLYRSGKDHINEHSDKTLDILYGSSIVNYSVGSARTFTLKLKKDSLLHDNDDLKAHQKIVLLNNSAFVCSWMTNAQFMHGIRPDKRDDKFKRDEELLYDGMRISLTFRSIATYRYKDPLGLIPDMLFGQGAKNKALPTTRDEILAIQSSSSTSSSYEKEDIEDESIRMLKAFSQENHDADFDWDGSYGRGFDIVCIHAHPPKST